MDVGRPMCRRSVPTSTTSSSPFLNTPTSALRDERHGHLHDVAAVAALLEDERPLAAGDRRRVLVSAYSAAPSRSRLSTPSTSSSSSGTRLTGTGAK